MFFFFKDKLKIKKNTRQRFVGPLYNTIQIFYTSGSVINFYCLTTKKPMGHKKPKGYKIPLGKVGPA